MFKTNVLTLFIVVFRLVCGAGAALSLKGMSVFKVKPCEQCAAEDFNHPYMQSLFMFIGEFGCLLIWGFVRALQKYNIGKPAVKQENKVEFKLFPHIFYFVTPTICDLTSSILYNMGMFYCLASIQQMLRNVTTVFIAAMSAAIWRDYRKKFDLPQLIGLVVLVLGACVVTYSSIGFNKNQDEQSRNPVLGATLIVCGCIFSSLFYIFEELFLRKIDISGLFGVGNEGLWGLVIMAILLPIFNVVPNLLSTQELKPKMEDSKAWLFQVQHCGGLIGTHISYVFFTLIANFTGMEITKRLSAAARSTFDAMRVIIVWVVSFIVGWEKWHNVATPLRFLGFVMLTVGVLMYNNIIKAVPYLKNDNIMLHGEVCKCQHKYKKIKDNSIETE